MEAHVPSYRSKSVARLTACESRRPLDRLPRLPGLGCDPDSYSAEDVFTDGVFGEHLETWIRDDTEREISPGYALGLDLDSTLDLWSSFGGAQ